jgi:hypothetical protein
MDYVSFNALLFNASKVLLGVGTAAVTFYVAAFVCLERFKNFEKFNVDGGQRDFLKSSCAC